MTPNNLPEDILDSETIANIKTNLLNNRQQLVDEMKKISNDGEVRFPDYGVKADENVQEIDDYTTNLATDKVLESNLRDIDNALDRIEKGTYGICKYCQQPIGKKRMLARPVASTCVSCKTKLQSAF